jgi:hypothetical protein
MSETTNTTNTTYKQFLDKDGLVAFWNKVMSTVTDIITSRLEEFYRKTVVQFGGEHTHNVTASADVTPELEVTNVGGTLVIACKSKTINIDVETNAAGEHSHSLYSDEFGEGNNPEDWFIDPEAMDNLFES